MNKCHSNLNWLNDTTPAINDTNLNYMDGCIDTLDDRVVAMDTSKLEAGDISTVIKSVSVNDETGVMTFTRYNDTTFTVDTKLEKVVTNWSYDSATQSLVLTLADHSTVSVSLADFITETEVADTATVALTLVNHKLTANIVGNSIGDAQMQTGYLTDCQSAKNTASSAATTANIKRLEAEGYAVGTQDGVDVPSTSPYYHNNAKWYSERTAGQSLSALNDVSIVSASDGQSLVYDSATSKWVNKNVSLVVALALPTDISAVAGDTEVSLSWNNPSDVYIGSTRVAQYSSTKVVRKVGSAPINENDGTVVYNGTSESYTDTGLTNGTTYHYGIFPYTTDGLYTYGATTSATPIHRATPITLALEGAKEDTITITRNGSTVGTCIFASGATTGSVDIEITEGETYTFTSSVAKNTTDGQSNYSKDVVLTGESTSVKMMPDNVIYWYGNTTYTYGTDSVRQMSDSIGVAPTASYNTNSITMAFPTNSSTRYKCGGLNVQSKIDVSNFNKFKLCANYSFSDSRTGYQEISASHNDSLSTTYWPTSGYANRMFYVGGNLGDGVKVSEGSLADVTGEKYIWLHGTYLATTGYSTNIMAMWFE